MPRRLLSFSALFLGCTVFLVAAMNHVAAFAGPSAIFTVTKAVDTNDGTCDADCSLREAVVAANATPGAETIVLPTGTYSLSRAGAFEDLSATGDLDITSPLTITGVASDTTIIDGAALDRVIEIRSPAVTLAHVAIRGGSAPLPGSQPTEFGNGGGILLSSGELTLQDSRVINNTASYGGGIYNDGGVLSIAGSLVDQNLINWVPGSGGGIYSTGTLIMTNTSILNQSVSRFGGAGGIYTSGTGTVTDSTISSNFRALANLGTLHVSGTTFQGNSGYVIGNSGTMQLYRSTVNASSSMNLGYAGCALGNSATLTIRESTISGNGGGLGEVACNASSMTIVDSTIADNSTAVGISNAEGGSLVLQNSIISNPLASYNCSGVITSAGFNLDSGASCGLSHVGDRSHINPLLGPLQNNGGPTPTQALLIGSPAIDAGQLCGPGDQRGVPRPQGRACDIGAYEYNGVMYYSFLSLIGR